MEVFGTKVRVCVTGAGGFVASWLVKLLLSKGYLVHGTVRDPSDEKNSHLKKLEKAKENLQLFKADLLDYNYIASAIAGCEGVFHVASPVPSCKVANPEVELIAPAVMGTLNVLKACSEAKVRRVVVVSSASAVFKNLTWPEDKVMDEDCWTDIEYCRTLENWYALCKTQAECEAIDYGKKHGLDVITLCPSFVIGPLLQSTVNATSLFLVNLLKGIAYIAAFVALFLLNMLKCIFYISGVKFLYHNYITGHQSVENRSTNFVDVRDVADALLLVYEKPEASGRYLCAPHGFSVRDVFEILKSKYPNYCYPKEYTEGEYIGPMSSEKLKKLGWKFRAFEESVIECVAYYIEAGMLDN